MSKALLHDLIDMVPENETDVIYQILLKFIPSDLPSEDEIQAIEEANESIRLEGTFSEDQIDWD